MIAMGKVLFLFFGPAAPALDFLRVYFSAVDIGPAVGYNFSGVFVTAYGGPVYWTEAAFQSAERQL